jgi:hypothetical protein
MCRVSCPDEDINKALKRNYKHVIVPYSWYSFSL